jgi:hypothetical protein
MTTAATRAAYYRKNKHKWREYHQKNLNTIREQKRVRYAANPDEKWRYDLKKKYGMSIADYNTMFLAQGGVCEICKRPERAIDKRTKKTRKLTVDHHHGSGKVRALLCMSCNRALGLLHDDADLISKAEEYIRRLS